jgi:hypothetical protein
MGFAYCIVSPPLPYFSVKATIRVMSSLSTLLQSAKVNQLLRKKGECPIRSAEDVSVAAVNCLTSLEKFELVVSNLMT